ncbi:MAG TPA: PA domain-containing protein [Verrucomicrobiae bacterium]|nr:PA domain-containing protein [Verrucomicrobiae bacterium]
MKRNRAIKRMGLATLAGGLAFVGSAEAVELVVDGSFESATPPTPGSIVSLGGTSNPGIGGGWSIFSTYAYSTGYALPLTNGVGQAIGGVQFLRPYPPDSTGISHSSDTVTQMVSLTASTTLTPAKIDAGQATYTMSAWFSSYETQGDYSDLTLEFQDGQGNLVDNDVFLGGQEFVDALPTAPYGKYTDAKYWGRDVRSTTVPSGARVALITIHSTAVSGLPDGYVDLVSLDVVDTTLTEPFVTSEDPADKAVNVGPVVTLNVGLQDSKSAVVTNSIRLYLDSQLVPATIQKAGTNTTVTYNAGLLPALSQHTYSIAFTDNGAPALTQTNTFHFTVANYLTLPTSLASALGSEDTSKPGFNLSVYQVNPVVDPNTQQSIDIPDSIEFDEGLLVGLAGTNVADLSKAVSGNTFTISNTVHWANTTGITSSFPGTNLFPGIPGVTGSTNDFVDDIRTYVRFPASGFYQMGVNNNDDLRLSAEETGAATLQVTAPTNMQILCVAIATNVTQLSFGGALPLTPLSAPVVYATPSGNPADSCRLATNTALLGKIALLDRGATNCTSADDAYQAQLAGAVAVLETTPGDIGFPFRLGDSDPRVTIPVLVIAENFGAEVLKGFLTNHVAVTASIQGDPAPRLAEWNSPKGFGSADSLVGFAVPTAGVYPMRLVAGHSAGDANLDWFSVQPDGTKILVNDRSNPNALLAFRARSATVTKPVLNAPTLSAGKIVISWTGTGTLEEAPSVTGPWQPSASQSNPQSISTSGGAKFYRIHAP